MVGDHGMSSRRVKGGSASAPPIGSVVIAPVTRMRRARAASPVAPNVRPRRKRRRRPGRKAGRRRFSARDALLGGELAELPAPRRVAQLAECMRLDLADPLPSQAELVADLLERP